MRFALEERQKFLAFADDLACRVAGVLKKGVESYNAANSEEEKIDFTIPLGLVCRIKTIQKVPASLLNVEIDKETQRLGCEYFLGAPKMTETTSK
jgi:hypothetical protein